MRNLYKELTENNGYTVAFDGKLGYPNDRYIVGVKGISFDIPVNYGDYIAQQKVFDRLVDKFFAAKDMTNYCSGAWVEKNKVYYDINSTFNELNEAVICGFKHNQQAIYDQIDKVVITLPKRQFAGTNWQQETYYLQTIDKLKSGLFYLDGSQIKFLYSQITI